MDEIGLVLSVSNRSGGRAYTDSPARGCWGGWGLHHPHVNPVDHVVAHALVVPGLLDRLDVF